jgi:DNA repair/transcription protein MET18/MMS19
VSLSSLAFGYLTGLVSLIALGFLAATLAELDDDFLSKSQGKATQYSPLLRSADIALSSHLVQQLVVFFGSMFAVDHKAGISAAVSSLRHLISMKSFSSTQSVAVLRDVVVLGDDFRLQAPSTRLEIYELIRCFFENGRLTPHLRREMDHPGELLPAMLRMCRAERDPLNLLTWFHILRLILSTSSMPQETARDVFDAFSAYFPVSMRASVASNGVTIHDLKAALRACFSASPLTAPLAFDFLTNKLDQGEAVVTAVKVNTDQQFAALVLKSITQLDILRTIKECVDKCPLPTLSVAPFAGQLWTSLKYEVRNGEVEEVINETLSVITAIFARLERCSSEPSGNEALTTLVEASMAECLGDLSDLSYATQAGRLMTAVASGGFGSFSLVTPRALEAASKFLRRPSSTAHTQSLLIFLNELFIARRCVVEQAKASNEDISILSEFMQLDTAVCGSLDNVYLHIWRSVYHMSTDGEQTSVLLEVISGMGEILRQRSPEPDNHLLCAQSWSDEVFRALTPCVVQGSSPGDNESVDRLAIRATAILHLVVIDYPDSFGIIADAAVTYVTLSTGLDAEVPDAQEQLTPVGLGYPLSRVSYIGCASLPADGHPAGHLLTLTARFMHILGTLLETQSSFQAANVVLTAIYGALLHFRAACHDEGLIRGCEQREVISETWEEDFARYYAFPSMTSRPRDEPIAMNGWSSLRQTDGHAKAANDLDVFFEYLRLSLYLVSQLYRQAAECFAARAAANASSRTSESEVESRNADLYAHQLANMAAHVFHDLDETEQWSIELHKQPFALFCGDDISPSLYHDRGNGRLNILSLGVFRGLFPSLVGGMVCIQKFRPPLVNSGLDVDPARSVS